MLIKRQVSGWNKLLIFEKRISNKRFSCTIYKERLHLRKNVIQFSFYWNTIALQYCVSFCCITTWISHIIHIFPPSWASLSHPILLLSVITEHQAEHPMQQLPTSYFTYGSVFSGHMSSSGITGSYCTSMSSFLVLHSDCINLCSHQQWKKVLFSPYTLQHLLFVDFFYGGHSGWCEMIPHVVLICISLVINDVEHLFMYLLAIYMSHLKRCLFRSSTLFFFLLNCMFALFFLLSCVSWLYILEINPNVYCFICKYFLPFWVLSFHLVCVFLSCAKAFKFN